MQNLPRALLALAALAIAPLAHAELYKYVDAAGRTHYTDNKAEAAQGGAKELKVAPPPAQAAGTPDWKRQEEAFKRRQAEARLRERETTTYAPRQQGRVTPENDAARCQLARDVVSGAVEHTNGAVTDGKDIQVARRDIEKFCR
jgi:hypothetical protein